MTAETIVHTAVVGSGLAGLSCARMIALSGKSVCVLEKAPEIGGHLLPFNRGGAHFEVGIHYIADTGPGSHWANACSTLNISPEIILLDKEFEELRWPGTEYLRVPGPLAEWVRTLEARFPTEQKAIRQYARALEGIWSITSSAGFPIGAGSLAGLFRNSGALLKALPLLGQSAGEFMNRLDASPQLYEALVFQHALIGVAPRRLSALIYLLVNAYYFHGACFVKGGGKALIDMLKHPDVDYRTRTDASVSIVDNHHDAYATCNGRRYPARFQLNTPSGRVLAHNVVWTPDPRLLLRNRSLKLSRLLRFQLTQVEDPYAYVVGYYATKRPLTDYGIGNRNYWFMGSLRSDEMYSGNHSLEYLAAHSPVYMSTGSLRDPHAIEPGNKIGAQGVFQAMFLCPPKAELWGGTEPSAYRRPEENGGYRTAYRGIKKQIQDILTARVIEEFPSLKGDLIWEELGTPLTHGRYLNSIGLNGLGFAPTVFDVTVGRPSPWTGVRGLFLCGQYIRPSHGIATVLANGVGVGQIIAR